MASRRLVAGHGHQESGEYDSPPERDADGVTGRHDREAADRTGIVATSVESAANDDSKSGVQGDSDRNPGEIGDWEFEPAAGFQPVNRQRENETRGRVDTERAGSETVCSQAAGCGENERHSRRTPGGEEADQERDESRRDTGQGDVWCQSGLENEGGVHRDGPEKKRGQVHF